jgi:streptogramin lyase
MIRQAVSILLTLACGMLPGLDFRPNPGQDAGGATPAVRPPAEIPFSRLSPDANLPVGLEPGAVASDDAVWLPGRASGSLTRVAADGNVPGTPVPVGSEPCASLVVAFGSVWVPLCRDKVIARVDATELKVTARPAIAVASGEGQIATAAGSVWAITDRKGVLSRIDPDTGAPVAEVYVAPGAAAVDGGKDALWVISSGEPAAGRLTRVNPHSNEVVEEIRLGRSPLALAVGEGAVWTLNADASVTRVDPETNKVVATIPLGGEVTSGDIAAGAGNVWVSTPGAPIVRIDPRTNRAAQRFTGEGGGAVLLAHGSIWVAAGPQRTWRLDPRLVEAVRR